MEPTDAFDALLRPLTDRFSGEAGVCFQDLESGEGYALRGDAVFSTASTAKLFILGALLGFCQRGGCRLDDRLTLRDADRVGGTGVLKELSAGLSLTVLDAATLMIIQSDNVATNLLLDYLGGVGPVNETLEHFGLAKSRVLRKISNDPAVTAKGPFGQAAPAEFVRYLALIDRGEALDERHRGLFVRILAKQQYLDFFPRYLPVARFGEAPKPGGVAVANKTGFIPGVRGDAGYLFAGSRRFAYAVLTQGCADPSYAADNEAALLIARIGQLFYRRVAGPDA